ncbi:uncharacterized protein LOC657564 [Tribolium castaneum]|uniref:Uncharacterized protein n=1 Tax=Tribolium castaneum TaxID=7070 RepID=D2A2I6_TRICA|nr:PREDICTED: uncharacterized protein LOC657564 [Tribolium castaneum]EFA02205.1 hypothetical protein TcasGA2_TC007863 [Tribolium castaneum]|eukprot:XP_976251.1 PREDICTED: uncharacterized protein LOC657564 [Tribolium castaneum]
MAYSMFECPKLHNARSLKFYTEECEHHLSFRHKNLPPDFDLDRYQPQNFKQSADSDSYSVQAHTSRHKRCPIYNHIYVSLTDQNDGDFVPKSRKKPKTKSKKSVIEKLEETYWANWKPDKNDSMSSKKSLEIQVIKSAPVKSRRKKIQIYPSFGDHLDETQVEKIKITSKCQEIQTDDVLEISKLTEDAETDTQDTLVAKKSEEELDDNKFLKHTDSFILNLKKQHEEKETFEQPKCIRLYKKPGKLTSKNYTRGGSYPLKSCLKKDSSFGKGGHRLGRPGSPLIVSSTFRYSRTHRY